MNMRYKKHFRSVVQRHYPDAFESLLAETESQYAVIAQDTQFTAKSTNPMDRRLDFAAYFLALIQSLEKHGEAFEQIRTVCLEITEAYIRPKNNWQQWLKRLPVLLMNTFVMKAIVRRLQKKTGTKGHPDGFLVRIITDKNETYGLGYGFDIVECGICKLFQKHQGWQYASILCEVDKLTSALAGLELVRSGTIANGAELCDFRFRKVTAE